MLWALLIVTLMQTGQEAKPEFGAFAFEVSAEVNVSTEKAYDLFTGDISPWWDHTFSRNPARFFIEARPGGGFYEYFDDGQNGVLHATVIFAERGKRLRLDGPLGLSGYAIKMVHTLNFEAIDATHTKVVCSVRASGEIPKGIPEVVEKVWTHFLVERYAPFVNGTLKPSEAKP